MGPIRGMSAAHEQWGQTTLQPHHDDVVGDGPCRSRPRARASLCRLSPFSHDSFWGLTTLVKQYCTDSTQIISLPITLKSNTVLQNYLNEKKDEKKETFYTECKLPDIELSSGLLKWFYLLCLTPGHELWDSLIFSLVVGIFPFTSVNLH